MKNPEDFFSISGKSVSKGRTLLPRVDFTAPSEARSVIKTQGRKKNEILVDFFYRGDEKNNTKTGKKFGIE